MNESVPWFVCDVEPIRALRSRVDLRVPSLTLRGHVPLPPDPAVDPQQPCLMAGTAASAEA